MSAHYAQKVAVLLPAIEGITGSLRQVLTGSNRDSKWWVVSARHGVYNFTQRECPIWDAK